jgi:ATP-dependent DNA helicase RecG
MEEIKSATQEFEETSKLFTELKWEIWLLHGRMKPKDKENIMNQFKTWTIKILVSTTVIEVWVDVPQATIIIIKNAERFGLSQLHQLRGRVWRNNIQSYCFMTTKSKSWDSYTRLKAMEKTNDWFELSKIDMINRGSWEILWIRQSWDTDIPIEILSDIKLLEKVQKWANELLSNYDNLKELKELKNQLFKTNKNLLI